MPSIVFAQATDHVVREAERECLKNVTTGNYYQNRLTPEISWAARSDILGYHWTPAQAKGNSWFNPERISAHISTFAPQKLPTSYYRDYERYSPHGGADQQQQDAYKKAANLYRQNQWKKAIPLFDALVEDHKSPYRAAAAYSAARAAIKLGHLKEGVDRIAILIDDPTLKEFRLAAHHLLGTMSYRTGAEPNIAARLSEIAHLLAAPLKTACRDAELMSLIRLAEVDLNSILGGASYRTLEQLASKDPMIDFFRVISAPTPFQGNYRWHVAGVQLNKIIHQVQRMNTTMFGSPSDLRLTDHAREKWLTTRNPLWGYALAQRTYDSADIALIDEMFDALHSLPDTEAVRQASPRLYAHFLYHGTRLRLMTGKLKAAETFFIQRRENVNQSEKYSIFRPISSFANTVVDGGVRYFLEQYNLKSARHWAQKTTEGVQVPRNIQLKVALTSNFDEVADLSLEGWGIEQINIVADLLPARKLVDLGLNKKLSLPLRRGFLGAGWLRLYMLDEWEEAKSLLPEMRESYPELATDIDNILSTWSESHKKRLVNRMLVRTPGLTLRSLWSSGRDVSDIFAIDDNNPNDGNWWCPLNINQMKVDLVNSFYADPLGLIIYTRWFNPSPRSSYNASSNKQGMAAYETVANKIISWHPLLKGVDFEELEKLSKISSGPQFLSQSAINWAEDSWWFSKLTGRDKHLPETLHLAVRSTRFGCRQAGKHGNYSRASFTHLHQDYAESEWTAKTPYWFDLGK